MEAQTKSKSNPYKTENVFNVKDYDEIVNRLNSLTNNSVRQWGNMNLTEMLEHCTIQLKLALYEIKGAKHEGSFILRTSFGRWIGLYGPCWQKGSITPSQMNIKKQALSTKDFKEEHLLLLNYLNTIVNKDNFQEHPIFGKLNRKDWGRLIWKHLDHHLRQFGK